MSEVVKPAFKAYIGNRPACFRKQLACMCDSEFIDKLGKGFSSLFFKITAKRGNGHVDQITYFFQGDIRLKIPDDVIKDDLDPGMVL